MVGSDDFMGEAEVDLMDLTLKKWVFSEKRYKNWGRRLRCQNVGGLKMGKRQSLKVLKSSNLILWGPEARFLKLELGMNFWSKVRA